MQITAKCDTVTFLISRDMTSLSGTPNPLRQNTSQDRWIVTGPSRSGTTLLASLLSRLGMNFGLADRAWDINSGYYEHPEILKAYSYARKWKKSTPLSDNLGLLFREKAIRCVKRALEDVTAIKYPPLSSELPELVKQAGYKPKLAISLRRFETYTLSRIRMEGVDWKTCKQDYLSTYHTAMFNLRLHGGAILVYEELTSCERHDTINTLMQITGADSISVAKAVEECVRDGRSQARDELADADCDDLYERLLRSR